MDPNQRTCSICSKPIPPHEGRGRPRLYCDSTCARTAERLARTGKQLPGSEHEFEAAPNGVGSLCKHCECAPRSPVGRLPRCPCRH